jgi:hypothetical protein
VTPRGRADRSLATASKRYLQDKLKGRGGDGGTYQLNVALELEWFAERVESDHVHSEGRPWSLRCLRELLFSCKARLGSRTPHPQRARQREQGGVVSPSGPPAPRRTSGPRFRGRVVDVTAPIRDRRRS